MKKTILLTLCFGLFCQMAFAAEKTMTWPECIKEASKNNPDLISARETINQSRASKGITLSSVFPLLNASASGAESKSKIDSQKTTTSDSYSYGVSGSLLIFDGLKSSNNIKAADQNIIAAEESYSFTSADIRFQLRTAFVNLLKAQQNKQVTQEIAKIREDELKLITLRYNAGLEHKGALLNSEASMLQAKLDLEQAVRNFQLSQKQLNKAMGTKEFIPVLANEEMVVKESTRDTPDFKTFTANHPSVKESLAKRNSADFSLRATRGSYYPQVSLQAGANKDGSQWPPQDAGLSAGVTVSIPIFEGGLRKAQVSSADAVLKQAEAQLRSSENTVSFSLALQWEGFREAVESVEVRKKTLEADMERAKIAEAQYSTGFITYDNWTIIEDNLVQSKKSFLDAQANAMLAEAQWINAKGVTLEYASQ
ncbi:MAG: TolC family protein [Candidatus Omnitrophica bacterium]|nr:TolC family protein [Candidatus Omnitrophota bacterium]